MKLGTQTGSMTNHIYSRAVIGQPEPVVGMGATVLCWTDRHPATIVEVGKIGQCLMVKVQEDNARRADKNGFSEDQTYNYTPNPKAHVATYRFRRNRWEEVHQNENGRWVKSDGNGLRIGEREKYHDFSF